MFKEHVRTIRENNNMHLLDPFYMSFFLIRMLKDYLLD